MFPQWGEEIELSWVLLKWFISVQFSVTNNNFRPFMQEILKKPGMGITWCQMKSLIPTSVKIYFNCSNDSIGTVIDIIERVICKTGMNLNLCMELCFVNMYQQVTTENCEASNDLKYQNLEINGLRLDYN